MVSLKAFLIPGGNVTGLSSTLDDVVPKQIDILAMALPKLSRIGVLTNPNNPNRIPVMKSAQRSIEKTNFVLVPVEAHNLQELDAAIETLIVERVDAVIVIADGFFNLNRVWMAELMLKSQLPTMFAQRDYALVGGLMSYGESLFDFYQRSARFVDKIFKGAKPADLPIEQPTRFKLVINRKTADGLGVTITPQLIAFADEVIE
jgi:putative tryptophan/tyrosine transport system substrate-binding protein